MEGNESFRWSREKGSFSEDNFGLTFSESSEVDGGKSSEPVEGKVFACLIGVLCRGLKMESYLTLQLCAKQA